MRYSSTWLVILSVAIHVHVSDAVLYDITDIILTKINTKRRIAGVNHYNCWSSPLSLLVTDCSRCRPSYCLSWRRRPIKMIVNLVHPVDAY